jgi:hypothetical protein
LREISNESIVQVDGRLLGLFQRSFPNLTFVPRRRSVSEESYDVHVPIASLLPAVFPSVQTVTDVKSGPFLKPNPVRVEALRKRFAPDGEILVGVSWQSKNLNVGERKSFSLSDLLSLLTKEGVICVSLQYGDVSEEIEELCRLAAVNLVTASDIDNFHDLDDHCALIAACDCIVSGCNTSAHIAGAIGTKGFVMVPSGQSAFWYWHNEVDGQSVWYPSLSLFKNGRDVDWSETVSDALQHVNEYITARHS